MFVATVISLGAGSEFLGSHLKPEGHLILISSLLWGSCDALLGMPRLPLWALFVVLVVSGPTAPGNVTYLLVRALPRAIQARAVLLYRLGQISWQFEFLSRFGPNPLVFCRLGGPVSLVSSLLPWGLRGLHFVKSSHIDPCYPREANIRVRRMRHLGHQLNWCSLAGAKSGNPPVLTTHLPRPAPCPWVTVILPWST